MLNLANDHNSSDRSTKSTPSHVNVLRLLVNTGFQVLFHSPSGVLFTFPSQYCFTIGHRGVVRLGGWSPRLPTRFLVSRGTLVPTGIKDLTRTRLSRSMDSAFQPLIPLRSLIPHGWSATPQNRSLAVWPSPLSLATTYGFSFDFSSWSY